MDPQAGAGFVIVFTVDQPQLWRASGYSDFAQISLRDETDGVLLFEGPMVAYAMVYFDHGGVLRPGHSYSINGSVDGALWPMTETLPGFGVELVVTPWNDDFVNAATISGWGANRPA